MNGPLFPAVSAALPKVALSIGGTSVTLPESVSLLDGGAQAYPRMLLAIAEAQRTVHLEVYAFTATGVGASFVEALGHAAGRGVKVQVLVDGWGSARDGLTVAAALRQAGCTVRVYHRLLTLFRGRFGRNHRKILLVDDEVAFLGGINIGDENLAEGTRLGWADLALEIRGPHCARLGAIIRSEPRHRVEGSLQIFITGLGGGWRLRRRYLRAFASAQKSINVAHGYFLPDAGIVRAITAAAKRGVRVRLLLAGQSDVPFARAATRSLYRQLLSAGVNIHEWNDSVLHAKVATIDGRVLLIGSFNLEPLSLANMETLVEVGDSQVVEQGEAWIEDHFARARSMTAVEAGTRWHRWLLDPIGRVIARMAGVVGRVIAGRRRRRASHPHHAVEPEQGKPWVAAAKASRLTVLAMALALSAGCATKAGSARAICTGDDCYEVGKLGAGWKVVSQDDGMQGHFNAATGGIILSYASCRDDAEATPLESLTSHLLVGYTDRRERSSAVIPFARREALRSVIDAKLDGVPMVLDLYVFKSNGCIFDLSYAARPAGYEAGLPDFKQFVEGFLQLPRPRA